MPLPSLMETSWREKSDPRSIFRDNVHENTRCFVRGCAWSPKTHTRVNFKPRRINGFICSTSSSLIPYHFSEEQHAFPGGRELFAWKNGAQDSLARPNGFGCLNVPHGGSNVVSALLGVKQHGPKKKSNGFTTKVSKRGGKKWCGGVRLLLRGGNGNNDDSTETRKSEKKKKKRNICFLVKVMPPP